MSSLPRSWHQISLQHNILDSNSRNPFSSLPWLAQATSTSESISKSWIQEGYPTHLSTASRSGAIELQREGRLAVYRGAGSSDQDIAVARANLRFPPSCGIAYFEVLVVSSGRDGAIGIGLADEYFDLESHLPGWNTNSYGYHGDDGKIFRGRPCGHSYGPSYSSGDFIGCILDFASATISFTKNGCLLGVAFQGVTDSLYAAVGFRTRGESLLLNFGQEPFAFDLGGYIQDRLTPAVLSEAITFPLRISLKRSSEESFRELKKELGSFLSCLVEAPHSENQFKINVREYLETTTPGLSSMLRDCEDPFLSKQSQLLRMYNLSAYRSIVHLSRPCQKTPKETKQKPASDPLKKTSSLLSEPWWSFEDVRSRVSSPAPQNASNESQESLNQPRLSSVLRDFWKDSSSSQHTFHSLFPLARLGEKFGKDADKNGEYNSLALLRRLVFSHLVQQGYYRSAVALFRASASAMDEMNQVPRRSNQSLFISDSIQRELMSAELLGELHDMLRSGRIPEVIDRLSELNPRLLEDDPNRKLLVRLHCAAFAMMVREAWEESSRSECTDVEACTDEEERMLRFRELCRPAIEYGRKYLSSWSSYDHSIQDRVVSTLSLIGYRNPFKAPCAHFLSSSSLVELIEDISSAVIRILWNSSMNPLEAVVRHSFCSLHILAQTANKLSVKNLCTWMPNQPVPEQHAGNGVVAGEGIRRHPFLARRSGYEAHSDIPKFVHEDWTLQWQQIGQSNGSSLSSRSSTPAFLVVSPSTSIESLQMARPLGPVGFINDPTSSSKIRAAIESSSDQSQNDPFSARGSRHHLLNNVNSNRHLWSFSSSSSDSSHETGYNPVRRIPLHDLLSPYCPLLRCTDFLHETGIRFLLRRTSFLSYQMARQADKVVLSMLKNPAGPSDSHHSLRHRRRERTVAIASLILSSPVFGELIGNNSTARTIPRGDPHPQNVRNTSSLADSLVLAYARGRRNLARSVSRSTSDVIEARETSHPQSSLARNSRFNHSYRFPSEVHGSSGSRIVGRFSSSSSSSFSRPTEESSRSFRPPPSSSSIESGNTPFTERMLRLLTSLSVAAHRVGLISSRTFEFTDGNSSNTLSDDDDNSMEF